jgi:hypothetical protein
MGNCITSECILKKDLEKEEVHLAQGSATFMDIHGNSYQLHMSKPSIRAIKEKQNLDKNKN